MSWDFVHIVQIECQGLKSLNGQDMHMGRYCSSVYVPLILLNRCHVDSKLAVVPRKGDRVALCEFQDGATTWTYLNHQVSGQILCPL